jgi:hypothetical protein
MHYYFDKILLFTKSGCYRFVFKMQRVWVSSNLGRSSRIQRLGHIFLLGSGSTRIEHREMPWVAAGRAPSSGYGALNLKATTPTRSRWLGHSVLLTFGGGNDPREASGSGAIRPGFDDGDSGSWWRFGSKKQSDGFLVTSSSSLIAPIALGGGESSSCGDYLRALGFGVTGKNSTSSGRYI